MTERIERAEQPAVAEPLVEVKGLKTYYDAGSLTSDPVRAVDGVSFDIHRGETLGLVGESGCGKTTLGRTILQLESATDGTVVYDGTDVTELSGASRKRWRSNAQIVFQDPESSLNDRMTVGEIVREPLDVHDWPRLTARVAGVANTSVTGDAEVSETAGAGRNIDLRVSVSDDDVDVAVRDSLPFSRDDIAVTVERGRESTVDIDVLPTKAQIRHARVRNLLAAVGLGDDQYYRYPHQFSRGQCQRIAIARALALEPEFVVLDEPVSSLDVSTQAKILNLLADLQAEFGLTYLCIAHDLSVVRHLCDRVAMMYLGNVVELGSTAALFEDPANPYTHSLLSAIPDPDPTAEDSPITLRGMPPSPRHPPAGCPLSTRCPAKIRPEAFADLDPDIWAAIDDLIRIVGERRRTDRTLRERARAVLGMNTRLSDVEAIIAEVFGRDRSDDLSVDETPADEFAATLESLPQAAREPVVEAIDHLRENREEAAMECLLDAFGSECDATAPEFSDVDERDRISACHRHDPEYDEVATVLSERFGEGAGR